MNRLALLLLANIFIPSDAAERGSIWKNEKRLKDYQQAWTSLNKNEQVVYYLIKATQLNSGPAYDNKENPVESNSTCWSSRMSNLNQSTREGVRHYKYFLTGRNAIYSPDDRVKAVSALNYTTTKNAVATLTRGGDEKYSDPVIFTDGKMCDLFSVPKRDRQDGCELWVKDEYKDDVPPCCSFIYDLLCVVDESYDIYDNQTCKSVVAENSRNLPTQS